MIPLDFLAGYRYNIGAGTRVSNPQKGCHMDINMVPYVANNLIERHGLAVRGWRFAWDHARLRAGCCKYRYKTITLSHHYVMLNIESRPDDVVDTILHEIAHALAGPQEGHGDKWKDICCQIGAKPQRYCAAWVEMPKGRYTATCDGCGKCFYRHKQMKAGRQAYCLKCGLGTGKLTYVDTTATAVTTVNTQPTNNAQPKPRKLR